MASEVGRMRKLASLKNGNKHTHGFDGIGWSEDIEGACGELAVAKFLGIYWNGSVNTFKAPDLPNGIQVRTRSKHDYDLIVRTGDPDNERFILVTGRCPEFRIQGWLYGRDAKQDQFRQTFGGRPEAFFVPVDHLNPMDTFMR